MHMHAVVQMAGLAGLALALALCLGPTPAVGGRYAGAYMVFVERMYSCEEKESTGKMIVDIQPSNFNVRRPSVLQTLSGNVTISMREGLNDDMWGRARMEARSSLKWVPNTFLFNFPEKACSNLRQHMPGFFRAIFKRDFKTSEPCVVPPGTYVLEKEPVNWTFPHFPVMPYGTWKFHFLMGLGKETFSCHNSECRTVPRTGHR